MNRPADMTQGYCQVLEGRGLHRGVVDNTGFSSQPGPFCVGFACSLLSPFCNYSCLLSQSKDMQYKLIVISVSCNRCPAPVKAFLALFSNFFLINQILCHLRDLHHRWECLRSPLSVPVQVFGEVVR